MSSQAAYDAENKGPTLLALMWTLTGVTAVIVGVRLFIRTKIIRNLGLDDYLIAVAMVIGIVNVIVTTIAIHHGFGKHTTTIGTPAAEKANFTIAISWIFGILSFAVPKLAIAALLARILNPSFRMLCALWGLTGFVGAVAIVNILIFFTSCDPPRAVWEAVEGAVCRDPYILINYARFNGAISAFTDIALAVYPCVVLWQLQMSFRKKVALCCALGVGAISACAAVVKTTYLDALANVADATYATWALVMWTNVEADLVVLGSCIPTMQPLLEFILGRRSLRSGSQPQSYPLYDTSSSRNKRSQVSRRTEQTLQVDSQEMILQEEPPKDPALMQIHRTDHVVVEYEMKGPEHDDRHHKTPFAYAGGRSS